MKRVLRFTGLLALLALTIPALAQEDTEAQQAQQDGSRLDALFVPAAADSDLYEIRSSELVLEMAGDDQEVADFAQRMIDEHTASSQRLAELAGGVEAEVPQEMSAGNMAKVEELRALSGDELIQAYLLQQELAHIEAITLYTAQADNGQNEELRTFAEETLPILQDHLEMVQSLRDSRAGQDGQAQDSDSETEEQPEGEDGQQ